MESALTRRGYGLSGRCLSKATNFTLQQELICALCWPPDMRLSLRALTGWRHGHLAVGYVVSQIFIGIATHHARDMVFALIEKERAKAASLSRCHAAQLVLMGGTT